MSDEAAFLAALKANPADDTARLVYADWLDEHDEPQKAEYLRLVAEVARGEGNVAEHQSGPRMSMLAKDLPADWRFAAGSRFALVLDEYTDKIHAIKWIRDVTGDGLGEAKVASESLPHALYTCIPFEMALAAYSSRPKERVTARLVPSGQHSQGEMRYRLKVTCSINRHHLAQDEIEKAEREVLDALRTVLTAAGMTLTEDELQGDIHGRDFYVPGEMTLDQVRARKGELTVLPLLFPHPRSWYLGIDRHPATPLPFVQ